MKQSNPPLRSASSIFRKRLSRNRKKPRIPKLRLLREVFKDYRALRVPRTGFWSRFPLQRLDSGGMSQSIDRQVWSTESNSAEELQNGGTQSLPLPSHSSTLLNLQNTSTQINPQSRRLRLMGFARATRDHYMPKISSVAQLASTGVSRSTPIEYDELGLPLTFPNGTVLTLFPSFTRPVSADDSPTKQDGYMVSVRGWMWCPGLMSRKNRLVLSLAKQLTKGGSEELSQTAIEKLSRDTASLLEAESTSDTDSFSSSSFREPSHSSSSSIDNLIKERLSSFIATSIAKASLHLVVGSEDSAMADSLVKAQLFTDGRGHFEKELFVPYKPSIVQVNATVDESVYAFQEVTIVSPAGFGIISDIDDTVKHTGVIGDKRELMSRLLTGQISTWNIPAVVKWYQEMLAMSSATFHYVSNSPWQLYNIIHQYFESVCLPPGLIHLKQYSGNIIASLREPSSSRKRNTLIKILRDFPQKKFLCIGDSGEHDFEAYVDLAKSHPGRILLIYIRAIPGSFSLIDDRAILTKLQWMTSEWKRREASKASVKKSTSDADLIDLDLDNKSQVSISRSQKLPPLVPKKPIALRSQSVKTPPPIPERISRPMSNPQLSSRNTLCEPEEKQTDERPPTPPPRPTKFAQVDFEPVNNEFRNFNTLFGVRDDFELEEVDELGALWIEKLSIALHELENTGTTVEFFEDGDEEFFKSSLETLSSGSKV